MNSGAIILAAGSSSRMGRAKQMLDIDGEKLLVKTIRTVLNAKISRVVVVLGAAAEAHRKLIDNIPVEVVYNPNWKHGMGSSLKAGLSHLRNADPNLESVAILVCDQPLLAPENISLLMVKHQESGKPIIASRYSQRPGVPALFDKSYFEKLNALPDNEGAKKLMLQNPSDVFEVDFPGGEIDLDTMEDYEAFRKNTL